MTDDQQASDTKELASVHEKLADVYRMRGEDAKAAEEYAKAIDHEDSAHRQVKLAGALESIYKYDKAMDALDRAGKSQPTDEETLDWLKLCWMRVFDWAADWELVSRPHDCDDALFRSSLALGRIYQKGGDFKTAIDLYRQAAGYAPGKHNSTIEHLSDLARKRQPPN